jgi:hypothetical protein
LILFFEREEKNCDVEVEVEVEDDDVDVDVEDKPPSSSHTRNSLPRVLTLTALPLGVISAEETEDVWPHSFIPGVIVREEAVEVQRYRVSVLSRCVARMYGCE